MSFDKQDTRNKIIVLVADKLNVDKNTITDKSSLQELGADSLDLVEIIMKLEEEFGIEINDEDAENLQNINQVIDYVHGLRKK